MEWTPEKDAQLTEMHRKRLSVRFIADWMRWPASAVRLRLVELGLVKPLSSRANPVVARAAQPAAPRMPRQIGAPIVDLADDDDDEEMRVRPGCPRGHLVSEAKIAALYSAAGGTYR
jgi:hypothetical protein